MIMSDYIERERERAQEVLKLQLQSAHSRWAEKPNTGQFQHNPASAITEDKNPLWTA